MEDLESKKTTIDNVDNSNGSGLSVDSFLMNVITDSMDGSWFPHWNQCTSSFYLWMKDPEKNKYMFIKDVMMDLKRINLILESIFEKSKDAVTKFVESVDILISQRERLEMILSLLTNGMETVDRTIQFNFCSRELQRTKLNVSKYHMHEEDSMLNKYKQIAIRKAFLPK